MNAKEAPFHRLAGDATPPARAFWMRAEDDVRLRLALWPSGPARGTVLLFPGRTEYVEKYAPVAQRLNAAGYAVLAIDWRGQGMSDRLQSDPRPGHVGGFADYQRDVIEMVVAAEGLGLPPPWHLLAHSMGGCIGLAALDAGLPVATAAFSAPMWGINLGRVPHRAAVWMSAIAARLGRGGHPVPGSGGRGSYYLDEAFATNLLTCDAGEWAWLLREAATWPDLTIGGASYDWLGAGLAECARLAALPTPDLPMIVALGGGEQVVSPAAIRDRAARWPGARLVEIEGARHEIMRCLPERRQLFMAALLDLFDAAA